MTAYNFVGLVPDTSFQPRYESQNFSPSMVEFQFTLTQALANGDTITTPANALPVNGIRIQEIIVISPELDTNATPTGTFNVGDSVNATRFINSATMGVNGVTTTGYQLINHMNVAQGLTNGVVSSGTNYKYTPGDATFGVGTNGPELILTVNAAVATGATTGTIRFLVYYWNVG